MKEDKIIQCPLCGEELNHHQWLSTHIYSCPACPFIGMEYYNNKSTEELADYLRFNTIPGEYKK